MNLSSLKNLVTSKLGRQLLTAQKHAPVIMFGAGVVGVVATVVLASRATLKLEEVLDEHHEDLDKARTLEDARYSEEDRKRDIAIIYGRTTAKIVMMYAPAVLVGVLAVGCLTGSHIMLTRRNLALTAAYAALDRGFREYRARVVNELGYEKDHEFRHALEDREIVVETEEGPKVTIVKQPAGKYSIYARIFDESSSNWNKQQGYNQLFIKCQQNYANDLLNARGHVFLNEVYDMLGLPRSKEGAVVGWVLGNGDDHIDFGVFEGDRYSAMRFINGDERSILLDFNVDGIIYNLI